MSADNGVILKKTKLKYIVIEERIEQLKLEMRKYE